MLLVTEMLNSKVSSWLTKDALQQWTTMNFTMKTSANTEKRKKR